jgi:hypothetical protein
MQRRQFPSVLLYSFGLALSISLSFNAFLLFEQSHYRERVAYDLAAYQHPVDYRVWEQLSACQQANLEKDSLIQQLRQPLGAAPVAGLVPTKAH